MAESQVPYPYQPRQLTAIRASLSEARFSTYLAKSGNHEEYAMALYLYNSRLAKAFLYPLGVAEVTLRNAIDPILVSRHGQTWHHDPTFRGILSNESRRSLDKAIERAGQHAPRDQVVATLTFDFWSNLFRPEYGSLWRSSVNIAFPHLTHGQSRRDIQDLVRDINIFRNRVAHHEPVLDLNVNDIYSKIIKLIELKCGETAAWMRHHSTVGTVVRSRPRINGSTGNNLQARFDENFLGVSPSTTIKDVVDNVDEKHPVIVCLDAIGRPQAAFTVIEALRFISQQADESGGLVSLADHSVADLIGQKSVITQWLAMDEQTAFGLVVKELQKPRLQIVVGVDAATGKATGTLLRAHRRY